MANHPRSAQAMVEIVKEEPQDWPALSQDPTAMSELQKLSEKAQESTESAWQKDKWLYRIAITVLGLLVLITAVSLAVNGQSTAEGLVTLGAAAVGALVGLFAPSPVAK